GMYNGVMPFLVRAFAANHPDDPGFADRDSITVKAWDFGESSVYAMTATLETGSSTFQSGGFAAVSLTGTIYYTQEITIQGGMFNLISYYLYPQNPSSSTLFGGLEGLRIVYEDNGTALIPEYGINTIGDIDLTEGYHLFADGDNQTLTVAGLSIAPADWSIPLAPNQFNSIAFLHDGPMDAELAMAAIDTLIEIVQDDAGGAWIPAFGATIGNLIPGKGYQVFTSADTAISFTYAPYQAPAARSMLAAARPQPAHFSFRRTGAPYTIVLQSAVIDGHILEAGDEVAVYDGDICVGAVVWDPETANILTAWRGDEELDLPGYRAGNAMFFHVYKTRFEEMVAVSASFTDETQRMFDGSSYSRVSLRGSPGLIPQQFALEQNYPNPFNPVTTIGYHVAEDAPVTIAIYNLMGQEVVRLIDSQAHAPGKYNIVWRATNHQGESVSAGVYLIHMSSSGFAKTKKMVLLK
ncbi:MAG: T9SS type A sorting domain-containing protein, partial [Gammaproteobacteria bacterium]|nr:T9SS type A sorting domain-containing protein [Gammaproteobacteria bacterium]